MNKETILLNKNSVVAASLMAMTAAFDVERTYTGGRYVAAKHNPLTKKKTK